MQTTRARPTGGNAAKRLVVSIAGMHRSGTSMAARLLNLCGLDLGSEPSLRRSTPFNARGYWEDMRFVVVNESILEQFSGSWDQPPSLPGGWSGAPSLVGLRADAGDLVAEFERKRRAWGWKDPRTSLTLPFWLDLLPRLRVVICVREPAEVALSLHNRDRRFNRLIADGLRLWQVYNASALQAAPPTHRVITRYERYFTAPERELARVLRLLGLTSSTDLLQRAVETCDRELRHYWSSSRDGMAGVAEAPQLYEQARALYEQMEAEANLDW